MKTQQQRPPPQELDLLRFVPFRLNRLAAEISTRLSEVYRKRFGLDIPEWRVLVTVAADPGCTAQHIVTSTRMHKTRVSRAVAQLMQRGLLARDSSILDARAMHLTLTSAGRRRYASLVPLALARERELMSCLDQTQLRRFTTALDRLEDALGLARSPDPP